MVQKKIIFSKRDLGFEAVLSVHSILLSAFPSAGLGRRSPGPGRCALIVPVMWTLSPLWMFHEIAHDLEDVASIREELCCVLRVEDGSLDAEK